MSAELNEREKKMDLNELAERAEGLSGPDREVELEIARALGWSAIPNPTSAGGLVGRWQKADGALSGHDGPPNWLGSIDAAMTLLTGHWLSLMTGHGAIAKIGRVGDWNYCASGEARSAALAITAAALRSQATSQ